MFLGDPYELKNMCEGEIADVHVRLGDGDPVELVEVTIHRLHQVPVGDDNSLWNPSRTCQSEIIGEISRLLGLPEVYMMMQGESGVGGAASTSPALLFTLCLPSLTTSQKESSFTSSR